VKYTELSMMRGEPFRIHATGCRDIAKDFMWANGSYRFEADDLNAYVLESIAEMDAQNQTGFTTDDWYILPCATKEVEWREQHPDFDKPMQGELDA
jgi:hypothetical protein